MANFEAATRVRGSNGLYAAELDPDWCVWSPAGGALLATAIRAAGLETDFARPLSVSCHFLSTPRSAPVELRVRSLRKTRVAESLQVSMLQGERPVIEVMLWAGDRLDGYRHADAAAPDVPRPDALKARDYPLGRHGMHTLWRNLEQRSCGPVHWERSEPAAPRQRDWIRLRDYAHFRGSADSRGSSETQHPELCERELAFLEAARFALVLDCFTWPAAGHAHVGDPRFVAPTISLSIELHQRDAGEWLLSDAHSPRAEAGCIAIHNRLFDSAGELVASASGSLICRPRPTR